MRSFEIPHKLSQSVKQAREVYKEFFGWEFPETDEDIRELAKEIHDEYIARQWLKEKMPMTLPETLIFAMREMDSHS